MDQLEKREKIRATVKYIENAKERIEILSNPKSTTPSVRSEQEIEELRNGINEAQLIFTQLTNDRPESRGIIFNGFCNDPYAEIR